MRITFFGAAQTVTGSQHLLEINGSRLLLDCGLFQGRRAESYERNWRLPFPAHQVEAMILSHAHIDHSGNIPNLVKNGFSGRIYATPATAHLTKIMLLDSAHIQEDDAEYLNRKRRKKGEPPIEPIYSSLDAARVAPHFSEIPYDEPFEPVPGVTARLIDAGHILGSAAICLDIEEKRQRFRLWFSGDIGRPDLPIIRDPVLPEHADYLVMECTYGDKYHADPQQAYDELRQTVHRTINRGGKVIIPAFAVGRTQEIVYSLHRMINQGELPPLPVYVDSPLAVDVSEIFRQHPECFDEETRQLILNDRQHDLFGFRRLTYIRSVEESKALNERREPMVIISASGMAEAGRILHHLKNNIEDPRNTILIVSWQAPNTLGRRLAEQETKVRIFGEEYTRQAEVVTIGGYSAHAGQPHLLQYAQATASHAKRIFLVHGEPRGALPLIQKLKEIGIHRVEYPTLQQTYSL
ncbi:MAG: Metallo-beta-lactamase family protein, RNA-specific [Anaerolineae bacterium]|nr:MAG: Metallo-beta-lactamase family protein, RNA-specific [Anaerolineae bacterium]